MLDFLNRAESNAHISVIVGASRKGDEKGATGTEEHSQPRYTYLSETRVNHLRS